jgi:hypothetical protein
MKSKAGFGTVRLDSDERREGLSRRLYDADEKLF